MGLGTDGPNFGSSDFIGSLRGQSEMTLNGMLSDPHSGVNSLDLILIRMILTGPLSVPHTTQSMTNETHICLQSGDLAVFVRMFVARMTLNSLYVLFNTFS